MRKVIKEFAVIMAFLMLMTGCYSYQKVSLTGDNYDLKENLTGKSRVKILSNGIKKRGMVAIVNDSLIYLKTAIHPDVRIDWENPIKIEEIDSMYVKQKDKKKTKIALGIPIIIITIGALFILSGGLGGFPSFSA